MENIKVFAFPNAGGTAKLFQGLKRILSEKGIELIDLDYARHGKRAGDPAYASFSEMSDDMAQIVRKNMMPGDRIVLFGYSMGALVAYDIFTRCFSDEERRKVSHLYLAAHEPPHIEFCGAKYADCDEDTFISGMKDMGGLDERLLGNPRFLGIFLDQIRSDYRLINSYIWNGKKKTLNIPTTVFYCEEDTPLKRICQWKEYVEDPALFSIQAFSGGHFFIRGHAEEIAVQFASHIATVS